MVNLDKLAAAIEKVTLDAMRIKSYDSIEAAIKQGVSQLTRAIEFMKR